MGPHRGPTSHYRGYAAGTPADRAMLPHAKAPHDIGMKCDPPWGRSGVVVPVRGCASLTRGYQKCDPYGVGSHAAYSPSSARTGSPPRRDAIHRVSHRPDGPTRLKNVCAGLRPERVRRDESRLYAADIQHRGCMVRPHGSPSPAAAKKRGGAFLMRLLVMC